MSTPAPDSAERREICAALVLSSGAEEPAQLGVFTDEELTALDGLETAQVVPMPWLVDSEALVEKEIAAGIALRGLIARRLVLPVELLIEDAEDLGPEDRRMYAVDPVQGILTLRRGFTAVITYQRMVAEQLHNVVQYVYEGDTVLEEEITADGYHHFYALPRRSAVDHAMAVIDQDEVAGQDGEPITVSLAEVGEHPVLGPQLDDTRAMTVASLITRTGEAEQVTFYATSDSLLVSRSDQLPAEGAQTEDVELEFAAASATSARELIGALLEAGSAASSDAQ